MFGPGRRDPARPVGARGGDRLADPCDEAEGDGPGRGADGDGAVAGGHQVGDDGGPLEHKRQRARPESPGQLGRAVGPFRDAFPGLARACDVDDHGVDRGPALGREDPRDGRGQGASAPRP